MNFLKSLLTHMVKLLFFSTGKLSSHFDLDSLKLTLVSKQTETNCIVYPLPTLFRWPVSHNVFPLIHTYIQLNTSLQRPFTSWFYTLYLSRGTTIKILNLIQLFYFIHILTCQFD